MTYAPVIFRWDGENMVPLPRFARQCDRQFVIGEGYPMVVHEERSTASHAHQFAVLNQAWKSLPENLADLFPSVEHLRKRALIDAGYFNEEVLDIGTNAAAIRVAAFMRSNDDFAHVVVRGGVVVIRTAKSQKPRHMNKAEFQASKQAVLDRVAEMLGVAPETLAKQKETA